MITGARSERETEQTNKTKEYFIFQFMRNAPCAVCFLIGAAAASDALNVAITLQSFTFLWMREQPCCAFRSPREHTVFTQSHFAFDFAHAYSPFSFFVCEFLLPPLFCRAHFKIVTIYAFYSAATLCVLSAVGTFIFSSPCWLHIRKKSSECRWHDEKHH